MPRRSPGPAFHRPRPPPTRSRASLGLDGLAAERDEGGIQIVEHAVARDDLGLDLRRGVVAVDLALVFHRGLQAAVRLGDRLVRDLDALPPRGQGVAVIGRIEVLRPLRLELLRERVPRGYIDGFIQWIKQIIGLCLTTFLQATILTAGLMVVKDNALLGLGLMLSAGEVPRIAGAFGLDTSTKANVMSAVYTAQAAVNTTRTIAQAIPK